MHSKSVKEELTENSTLPPPQIISNRLVFILFILSCIIFFSNPLQVRHDAIETPTGAPQISFKQGSAETKIWFTEYYERYRKDLMAAIREEKIAGSKRFSYLDIVQRLKAWIPYSSEPNFMFFYVYVGEENNIVGGVGTNIFYSRELMNRVKEFGRRDFELKLNQLYCNYSEDSRPPWKYLDDIFSHDLLYMVGIHRYPLSDARDVSGQLIPFIIKHVSSIVETDMWEFWVPRPLGVMPQKLAIAGFQPTRIAYLKRDGSGHWSDSWLYTPNDYVQAFNEYVMRKSLPQGQLLALSKEFSWAYLGHQIPPIETY